MMLAALAACAMALTPGPAAARIPLAVRADQAPIVAEARVMAAHARDLIAEDRAAAAPSSSNPSLAFMMSPLCGSTLAYRNPSG